MNETYTRWFQFQNMELNDMQKQIALYHQYTAGKMMHLDDGPEKDSAMKRLLESRNWGIEAAR